jgi:streptogramin lyase
MKTIYAATIGLSILALTHCGVSGGDGSRVGEKVGTATAAITLAPTNALCAQVQVTGSGSQIAVAGGASQSTVTQMLDLAAQKNDIFALTGLPLGVDVFTATAYDVVCANAIGAPPTWISDSATATVTVGTPVKVTFEMRLANDAGSGNATVGLDFPQSTSNIVTEFQVGPAPGQAGALFLSGPIATGPDGNLWFGDFQIGVPGFEIARITTNGAIAGIAALPATSGLPLAIAAGPDGNLWFTESTAGRIGRITPSGVLTEFPLPPSGLGACAVAAGPDGNMWFMQGSAPGVMDRVTIGGTPAVFPTNVANSSFLSLMGIATGPDGNLWFVDFDNAVGRMTVDGAVTEFAVPSQIGRERVSNEPFDSTGIAQGPDGNVWFAEAAGIGRITTGGTITEFAVPTPRAGVAGIAAGPDGNVWFTEFLANQIGRITPAGTVTEFPLVSPASKPAGITSGPDGNLWFTQPGTAQIGRITP